MFTVSTVSWLTELGLTRETAEQFAARLDEVDYGGFGVLTRGEFNELVERRVDTQRYIEARMAGMELPQKFETKTVGGTDAYVIPEPAKAEYPAGWIFKDALLDDAGIKGLHDIRQQRAARRDFERRLKADTEEGRAAARYVLGELAVETSVFVQGYNAGIRSLSGPVVSVAVDAADEEDDGPDYLDGFQAGLETERQASSKSPAFRAAFDQEFATKKSDPDFDRRVAERANQIVLERKLAHMRAVLAT
jgi:hypothetical protein